MSPVSLLHRLKQHHSPCLIFANEWTVFCELSPGRDYADIRIHTYPQMTCAVSKLKPQLLHRFLHRGPRTEIGDNLTRMFQSGVAHRNEHLPATTW